MSVTPFSVVMADGSVKNKQYVLHGQLVDLTSAMTAEQNAQAVQEAPAALPGDDFNSTAQRLVAQSVAEQSDAARDGEMARYRKRYELESKMNAAMRPEPASREEYDYRVSALRQMVWEVYEGSRYLAFAPSQYANTDELTKRPLVICHTLGGIEYMGDLNHLEFRVLVDAREMQAVKQWEKDITEYHARINREAAESQMAEAMRVAGPVLNPLLEKIARLEQQQAYARPQISNEGNA